MERKRIFVTTAVSIVLLAVVLLAGNLLGQIGQVSGGDSITISEVMTRNEHYPDKNGRLLDYIELHNPSDHEVDISGYKITDKIDDLGYTFPQGTTIPAGGYLLCQCNPDGGMEGNLNFGLSREGETVYLYNSANVCIQTLKVPALPDNQPYVMGVGGNWSVGEFGTPGFANTQEGYALWLDDVGVASVSVVFSEVQTANYSSITNTSGSLCDWIELYNPAQESAVLNGYYITDDPAKPMKWRIPELTIEAGGYAVICCTDREDVPQEMSFGLSKNGCTLVLTGPVGNTITTVECPALQEDTSWQRMTDGSYLASGQISPGYENTENGRKAYLASRVIAGPLVINEVMPANDSYLYQSDGQTYDWVELKNISDEAINLADFAISDDSTEPLLFSLPEQVLQPGELVVIILSGNTELTDRYIHAPFSLNKQRSWLYVSHMENGYSDYIHISKVPLNGTVGRENGSPDVFYYDLPTPGQENGKGYADISADPFVQTPGGIYNDVDSVSVVLSGEGNIYYTLDGSVPTANSRLYTGPITLTKTTTVRAVCYGANKLPSCVVTTGYIINENHTLPVLSVSVDPDKMFGGGGIYTNYTANIEIPCNMAFYEETGSFSVDCGIKMFGHTGLEMAKKSFKVNFRGRYGDGLLTYPVYGDEGPEVYDSLIIRSGQDYPQSIFRDELFTSLCRDMSDTVLAQRDKFCILYINGQYRGIYCIKEAFSEFYYASNRGVSEESVQVVQAPVYPSSEVFQFMNYLGSHDITDPDNYAYACTVFNMESLIDWIIIQGYSTNGDVQQNLRYFRSSENGNTFEMAFYDLDWAFYYHHPFLDVLSNDRGMNWQHLRITTRLMQNPTFRQQFLERLSYHMENTLSNENVLAKIDYYEQLLAPEVARERARWGGTYNGWTAQVNEMRKFVAEWDHMADLVARLQRYIGLTQAEKERYFWRWVS